MDRIIRAGMKKKIGVMEQWSIGVLEKRRVGVLGYWDRGIRPCSHNGVMV
jgi:hypothetical protein